MKLFTNKSFRLLMILIVLATILTFFQNKNIVKFDDEKTIVVDKYNNNTEVKVEKNDFWSWIIEFIRSIFKALISGGFNEENDELVKEGEYYVIENYKEYKQIGSVIAWEVDTARAYAQLIRTGSNIQPGTGIYSADSFGLKRDDTYHKKDNDCVGCTGGCTSLSGFYKLIKEKLKEGKPVVVYVGMISGSATYSESALTIIGIKSDAYNDDTKLNTGSFLAIDPYDANLCNMLYNGKDCAVSNRGNGSIYVNLNGYNPKNTCVIEYAK